nr:hypothetical protein [Carnobacterium maltaromaticum]
MKSSKLLSIFFLLSLYGCVSQKDSLEDESSSSHKISKQSISINAEYIFTMFKKDNLSVGNKEIIDHEKDSYNHGAIKIIQFDIEDELEYNTAPLFPPNKTKKGRIIQFNNIKSLKESFSLLSNTEFIDTLSVDTNYINPYLFIDEQNLIILQINSSVSNEKIKKYESSIKTFTR